MKGLIGQKQENIRLKLCDSKGKELIYADMDTLNKRYDKSYNIHLFVLPDGRVLDVLRDYEMGHEEFAQAVFNNLHNRMISRKISKVCRDAKKRAQDMGKDTNYYPYINYPQLLDMLIQYFGWIRVFQYSNIYGSKPATCTIDFPNPVLFGVDYTPEQEKTIKELHLKRNIIKDDEWEVESKERLKAVKESFTDLFSNTNVR